MRNTNRKHLLLFYNLSRPWEYYGFSTLITALGVLLAGTTDALLIAQVVSANFLACMFIFVFNDIEDREYDALDAKKRLRNPVASGELSLRQATVFCCLIATSSLLLFSSINNTALLYGSLILLLGFLYSWRKIQLKSKPFLDLLSHGLYFGPLLLLIGLSTRTSTITPSVVAMCIAVFLLSVVGDINNETRDHEVDRLSGISNTASVVNLAKYKLAFSIITLLTVAYIFFFLMVALPAVFNVLIIFYSIVHSVYILYLVRRKRIQLYEYDKRNVLYIGFAIIIILSLVVW